VHVRTTLSPLKSARNLSFAWLGVRASVCAQQWQPTMTTQNNLFTLPPVERNVLPALNRERAFSQSTSQEGR
jgi:hypothetical protein